MHRMVKAAHQGLAASQLEAGIGRIQRIARTADCYVSFTEAEISLAAYQTGRMLYRQASVLSPAWFRAYKRNR